MVQKVNAKNYILAVLDFMLAAVFVAVGGTMYQYIDPVRKYLGKGCLVILAVVIVLYFFIKKPYKETRQFKFGLVICEVILAYLLVFILINPVNVKSYVLMLCQVIALGAYLFICCGNDDRPGVIKRYCQLMTVIAVVSLICWVVFSLLRIIPASGSVDSFWDSQDYTVTHASYFGIYFEPQYIYLFDHPFTRNCAFFTEAPMFAWHLVIALLAELFVNKKTSRIRTVILSIAVISTISTIGIFWAVGALIIKAVITILKNHRYKALPVWVKAVIWSALAAIVIVCAILAFILLKEKLFSTSGDTRIEDFKAGLKAWRDSFWIGSGFGNREPIYMHRTVYSNAGYSNGIMEIAAEGGVYLLICFTGPFIFSFIDSIRKKNAEMAVFTVLVFVLASITSSQYTCLMYFLQLFMLFGLMSKYKRRKKTE